MKLEQGKLNPIPHKATTSRPPESQTTTLISELSVDEVASTYLSVKPTS